MSTSTTPAFVHRGNWNQESRAHECLKWFEDFTRAGDVKAWNEEPYFQWLTQDHKLIKSNGESVHGGEASWASLKEEVFAPFAQHLHYPELLVVWESNSGWEILGVGTMYWNLIAPGDGLKIIDHFGKEWDGAGPGAYHFKFVKQSDGRIKLSEIAMFVDPTAAVVTMLKRGMIKTEDLLK